MDNHDVRIEDGSQRIEGVDVGIGINLLVLVSFGEPCLCVYNHQIRYETAIDLCSQPLRDIQDCSLTVQLLPAVGVDAEVLRILFDLVEKLPCSDSLAHPVDALSAEVEDLALCDALVEEPSF